MGEIIKIILVSMTCGSGLVAVYFMQATICMNICMDKGISYPTNKILRLKLTFYPYLAWYLLFKHNKSQ